MPTPSQRTAGRNLLTLATAALGALQPAEARVIEGAASEDEVLLGGGQSWDRPWLSDWDNVDTVARWGPERDVRAEVIRWLCIDKGAAALVDPDGIRVRGARVTGKLDLAFANVPFPLELKFCRIADGCRFVGCEIGRLNLEASWTGPVSADGANIKQSLRIHNGFRCDGTVSLVMAKIAATLICEGAALLNPGGDALSADGLTVGGDAQLRSSCDDDSNTRAFRAQGRISLIGANIGGDIDCTGGQFSNPYGDAIQLQRATVGGGLLLANSDEGYPKLNCKVDGAIDLQAATVKLLSNPGPCWPDTGRLKLNGFAYSCRDDSTGAEAQLKWLQLDTTDPTPTQPYSQLAKVLLDGGDSDGAKMVQQAKERVLTKNPALKILKAPIGYGYKPGNAVWGLLFLIVLGALLFWANERVFSKTENNKTIVASYPGFQPAIYSCENTFPLIKLGQTDQWKPDPDKPSGQFVRWFMWIQTGLGWFFTGLFAAAVSGIVQHGE